MSSSSTLCPPGVVIVTILSLSSNPSFRPPAVTMAFLVLSASGASDGARGWLYLRRFFLPAALPALVTGSITAWGGGWNALVLGESVTAGGRTYAVTGLGALLDRATYVDGDVQMIALTILSMVAVVLFLNRLAWRPLFAWASLRCRLEP